MFVRLLLVDDSRGDTPLLQRSLEAAYPGRYLIAHATSLGEARAMLACNAFHAALVGVGLPDSEGMHAVDILRVRRQPFPWWR